MDDDATTPFEDRLRSALDAGIDAAEGDAGAPVADRAALGRRIATHRRRSRTLRAAAVVTVVASAAVGGWALGQDGDHDDVEQVAGTTTTSSTAAAPPPEIAVSDAPLPVVGAGTIAPSGGLGTPPPGGSSGSIATWSGPAPGPQRPSAALFTRTLPDGTQLDVRGNRFDPVGYDIPPFWDPPGWCLPAGDVYVGVRLPEAVGQATGVRYDDVRPGEISATVTVVGEPEGHPQWVVIAQAPPGAETLRATFPGGGSDEVALTEGLAVLTAPRSGEQPEPDANGMVPGPEIVALDADGEEVARGEVPWTTSYGVALDDTWVSEATPAPLVSGASPSSSPAPRSTTGDCAEPTTLPAPGAEQPADPVAAEAEVRATWDAAVGQPAGTPPADVYDDTTGLAEAQAELREAQGDELLDSVTIPIDAVVFADADTAYVQYGVHVGTYDTTYFGRFAELVHVDGRWKVTRASVCRLLSLGGGTCEPLQEG